MNFSFDGAMSLPGIQALVETYENLFYWSRYEDQVWTGVVLVGSSRDAGNSPTDILRPGILLGQIVATGKLKEWNPTGTDGSEYIFGVLGPSQKMQRLAVDADRWLAPVMVAGKVKADNLFIPGNAALGIVGDANEYLVRGQMANSGRFLFDDTPTRTNPHGGWHHIRARTTDLTVTEAMNNTLFTTRGAVGTVIFTLPVTPKKGLRYGFYNAAGQTMTITSGTADTLVAINDLTADTLSFSTASLLIGGFIEVIGDGTGWLTIVHAAQTSDGTTSGQLVTVAT